MCIFSSSKEHAGYKMRKVRRKNSQKVEKVEEITLSAISLAGKHLQTVVKLSEKGPTITDKVRTDSNPLSPTPTDQYELKSEGSSIAKKKMKKNAGRKDSITGMFIVQYVNTVGYFFYIFSNFEYRNKRNF